MNISAVFFSGTGNTEMVLDQLGRYLGIYTRSFIKIAAEDVMWKQATLALINRDTMLLIAFPVYDLKPPGVIIDCIRKLPHAAFPVPVVIISTRAIIGGDANNIVAAALRQKGYMTIGKFGFYCPSNGIATYEKPDHPRFRSVRFESAIDKKLSECAQAMIRGYDQFKKHPFRLFSPRWPVYSIIRFFSARLYGDRYYRGLRITDSCTVCGRCAKRCPDRNLQLIDGRILIKSNRHCTSCLRCITECRQKAIDFTSSTRHGTYSPTLRKELFQTACVSTDTASL